MKGIASSSSCYVDPLYYFSRLCGVNQPLKRFVYKNERKEGGKKEVVVSYFESGNSLEAGRKKSRPVGVDYKRVNVSRASASRRVRCGAKIVESDCSD
jgi:DNA cross-link repair 1B protein